MSRLPDNAPHRALRKAVNRAIEEGAPVYENQPARTIDITPTWTGLLPALLAIIENGTPEGRAIALAELRRMAEAADRYNDRQPVGDAQ